MLDGFSAEYLLATFAVWIALAATLYLFVRGRPWQSKRPRLRSIAPLLLFSWTTCFLAAAAETGFALAYDTTDSFGLTKIHQRWYRRHVKRNNWKHRDNKDYFANRKPTVKRLTILGDSFAFGHGVADISQRLGEQWAKIRAKEGRADENWEVYNVADPGADTLFQIKTLKELSDRGFQTDEFLLVYNLNDIEGLVPELDAEIMGSIICPQPAPWNWPCHHLYLPNFLYYRYLQYSRPEVRDYFGWLKTAYRGNAWTEQKERLKLIADWCRKRKIGLRVAVFPFLHNLNDYAFESAHAEIALFWQSIGVPTVDLLGVMKQHKSERLIVGRYDAHPNERAHRLAARAIFDSLGIGKTSPH